MRVSYATVMLYDWLKIAPNLQQAEPTFGEDVTFSETKPSPKLSLLLICYVLKRLSFLLDKKYLPLIDLLFASTYKVL